MDRKERWWKDTHTCRLTGGGREAARISSQAMQGGAVLGTFTDGNKVTRFLGMSSKYVGDTEAFLKSVDTQA